MSSEPHRDLLVKVLNEAHVAQDISIEGFGGLVNNITANNYLSFAEEEIPVEGRGHNRALHVSVKCMDHVVVKVLIDNGSSLNVMPKSTLEKLPFNAAKICFQMRDLCRGLVELLNDLELALLNNAEELTFLL